MQNTENKGANIDIFRLFPGTTPGSVYTGVLVGGDSPQEYSAHEGTSLGGPVPGTCPFNSNQFEFTDRSQESNASLFEFILSMGL